MSFELPRKSRDLRFSGESRALGEPRRNRTVPPPGRSSTRDLYEAEPIATPFAGSLPPPNAALDFDDNPTTVFDREGRDVIAGGFGENVHAGPPETTRLPPPPRAPQLPSVLVNLPPPDPTVISAPARAARPAPPLAVWIVAAAMLGVLSYVLTPIAFARAQVVLHAKR